MRFLKSTGNGRGEGAAVAAGTSTAAPSMSFTRQAITRTHCRRLIKFIRVAQYLFDESIATLLQGAAEKLLSVLVKNTSSCFILDLGLF